MGVELEDLGQFHCTERYHNVMGFQVTDGVAYIMENSYSWFVTDMLVILRMKFPGHNEFKAIKLKREGGGAVATIEDGDGGVLYSQKYAYTDATRDLMLFYIGNVVLLSGEY